MGNKRVLLPAEEVDVMAQKYEFQLIKCTYFFTITCQFVYIKVNIMVLSCNFVYVCVVAPHLTGFMLKLFVKLLEAPVFGPFITDHLKKQNHINEVLIWIVFITRPYDITTIQFCFINVIRILIICSRVHFMDLRNV